MANKKIKPSAFRVQEVQHRIAQRFGYEERSYRATFDQRFIGHRLIDVQDDLEEMFREVIDRATEHHGEQDRARVIVHHNDLRQDIVIHMRPQNQITPQSIMNRIEKVLQSEESLSVDNSFHIEFGILHEDRGGGATNPYITIPNDELTIARAIVVAMARLKEEPSTFKTLCKAERRGPESQYARATNIINKMKPTNPGTVTYTDFENHLKIQIIVIGDDLKVLYGGRPKESTIFLYENGGVHAVTKIHQLLKGKVICTKCTTIYSKHHTCNEITELRKRMTNTLSLPITNTDIGDQYNSIIQKKCMVFIPELTDDTTCVARTIVVCLAKFRKDNCLVQLTNYNRAHYLGANG